MKINILIVSQIIFTLVMLVKHDSSVVECRLRLSTVTRRRGTGSSPQFTVFHLVGQPRKNRVWPTVRNLNSDNPPN
ncbi:hypothetical protein [Furfurilactobacillus rossiae]|uniref:hypothetical protein n=1 Tax=Furfurilactobacillus rossiae TaxID=231049 RepID=UPI001ED98725|nr:hypothetical protein [Furfurilactobacillus rossiae]